MIFGLFYKERPFTYVQVLDLVVAVQVVSKDGNDDGQEQNSGRRRSSFGGLGHGLAGVS